MEKDTELATINTNSDITPAQLLSKAIDKLGGEGAESVVAAMKEIMVMQRDQEHWDAEKEFNLQLAEFQDACPSIHRSKKVDYATKAGGRVKYDYAELNEIAKTVRPLLHPKGFSFSWDTKLIFVEKKPFIEAHVDLLHKNGHSKRSTFTIPVPSDMAKMNDAQKYGAVKTYAIRQALVNVLGLTHTEDDTDSLPPSVAITAKQAEILTETMRDSIAPSRVDGFLKMLKVDKLEDLPLDKLQLALHELGRAKAKSEKKAKNENN